MILHDRDHYIYETVSGRGKDAVTEKVVIRWEEINTSELVQLVIRDLATNNIDQVLLAEAVHKGLSRRVLIALLRGKMGVEDLSSHPLELFREQITELLIGQWVYICSQFICDIDCSRCPDAQVLECYLGNNHLLPTADRQKINLD